jgi:hypothetical protein
MGDLDPPCLRGDPARSQELPIQVPSIRPGCSKTAYQGDLPTRVRFGYRRVHVLLRREGWAVNAKRIYRLYKEMGMQLRNKTPKRRVKAKLREDRAEGVGPNDAPRQPPGCRPFGNRIIRLLADDGPWTSSTISSRPVARSGC